MDAGNAVPPETDPNERSTEASVARVVAAFAQRPDTTADEIVALTIRLLQVFSAKPSRPDLAIAAPLPPAAQRLAVAASPSHSPTKAVPALPIDQAVTSDKVYCLCCGRGFTMLKRHLKAEHGLTEEEYRLRFGLPEDMPLVAPNYSERKAAYAKRVGLGKYQREIGES